MQSRPIRSVGSHLRLVVSQPDPLIMAPSPDMCRAIAISVADAVGAVCAQFGRSATLEDTVHFTMDHRGVTDLEPLSRISLGALKLLRERERAAIEAHRRPKPPRRPRSRAPASVQLWLPFPDLGRSAA